MKKFIKFLNFCQIRLEPPENENQKVPLAKKGASPPNAPRNKYIIIPEMTEKNKYIFKFLIKYTSGL